MVGGGSSRSPAFVNEPSGGKCACPRPQSGEDRPPDVYVVIEPMTKSFPSRQCRLYEEQSLPLARYDSTNASRDNAEPSRAGAHIPSWIHSVIYPKTGADGCSNCNCMIHQTNLRAALQTGSKSLKPPKSCHRCPRIKESTRPTVVSSRDCCGLTTAQELPKRLMGCSLEARQLLAVRRNMSDVRSCCRLQLLSLFRLCFSSEGG
jgi:hypothetical protein